MKKIALVSNNIIENIAVWDGVSNWEPGHSIVELNDSGKIGEPPPEEEILEAPSFTGMVWMDTQDVTTFTVTSQRITQWIDKQGSGVTFNVASGSTGPLYVNNEFHFNNNILESSDDFPLNWSGYTALMVITNTSRNGNFFASSVGQIPFLGSFNGERVGLGSQGGIAYGIPRNVPCVIGTVCNGSTTHWKFVIDEESHLNIQGSAINTYIGAFPKVQLGGSLGSGANGNFKTLGYFFFNRILTDKEIKGMSRWIKDHYSIADLPEPTWNVVIDGNSLSWGLSGVNTSALYDGILAANGSPTSRDIEIRGWTGQTTPNLTMRGVNWIDSRINYEIPSNKRILVFWEGTNDFHLNNITDVQCFNNIKTYCQTRKYAGWKIVVATILPMKTPNYPTFETYRTSVNDMLRTALLDKEPWIDEIADIASDPILGLQSSTSNTLYYKDGTHLTDLGHNIAKTYVTEAINKITGIE